MARFGKPLAVAAFALCVLFLGFAAAVVAGGPNWGAKRDALTGYEIGPVGDGPDVRYSVVNRVTAESVATADSLPAAVVAAYKDRAAKLRAEKSAADERIAAVEGLIPRTEAVNAADTAAFDARLDAMRAEYEDLSGKLVAATAEGAEAARRAGEVRAVADVRAEDLTRLRIELDAVRADLFRVRRQIEGLRDLKVRLDGSLARAERRAGSLAERSE